MNLSPGRRLRSILLLALAAVVLAFVTPAAAQTGVVVNPNALVFAPSTDHNTLLTGGQPAVSNYRFDVYSVGAAQPFQSTNIGKPAPSSDGSIYYDFSGSVMGWPLPGGNYEARVVAVGPSGSGTSAPSNSFAFSSSCTYALSGTAASVPAAGGGTQVSVTTGGGCRWTATSNVSWVALSAGGGTGSGTIIATVAANGSTASRTATLMVAGQAFTISQAGTGSGTPSQLPAPWVTQDIGSVGAAGSASYSSATFTVSGSGADIWGSADSFRYVHQAVTGNVEIVARVTGEQNTHQYAKAGVMLREALTPGSAQVLVDVVPSGSIEVLNRASAGGSTAYLGGTFQPTPSWLKLTRVGSTAAMAVSADGFTWRQVGSVAVAMGSSVYVGLAVTSHDTSVRNVATFDNVTVTPLDANGLPASWSAQDIGSVGLSGSTSCAGARFTVTGAGADIWSTADSFQFASRLLGGDGELTVRVTGEQNTNYYAKAGIMLRSALTSGSAHVILDVLPNGSVEFMTRSADGGSTSYLGGTTQAFPAWLRLVRRGSTVTASTSGDGTTWRTVGTTSVAFGSSAYAGLAVTSHNTTLRNTATFDNVSVR